MNLLYRGKGDGDFEATIVVNNIQICNNSFGSQIFEYWYQHMVEDWNLSPILVLKKQSKFSLTLLCLLTNECKYWQLTNQRPGDSQLAQPYLRRPNKTSVLRDLSWASSMMMQLYMSRSGSRRLSRRRIPSVMYLITVLSEVQSSNLRKENDKCKFPGKEEDTFLTACEPFKEHLIN